MSTKYFLTYIRKNKTKYTEQFPMTVTMDASVVASKFVMSFTSYEYTD